MVAVARLAGDGDVTIEYDEVAAVIRVQDEKAAGPTALCKEMERVRLDKSRAEQERQAAVVKAATEKTEAQKKAKRIKRVAAKERKKVLLAANWPREARPSPRSPNLRRWPRPPPRSSRR